MANNTKRDVYVRLTQDLAGIVRKIGTHQREIEARQADIEVLRRRKEVIERRISAPKGESENERAYQRLIEAAAAKIAADDDYQKARADLDRLERKSEANPTWEDLTQKEDE